MGFGSTGHGGTSAPFSNLYSLAPPFTIDESLPKQNPLGSFPEARVDPYAFASRIPQQNWPHLHHPPPATPNLHHPPMHHPLPNLYPGAESIRPHGLPSTSSYGQPTSNFSSPHTIGRSHFPQYPPPAFPGNSHSLLSTPSLIPSERFLQIDYTQRPGMAYTTPWGGSRNRVMDEEHRRRLDTSSLYPDYGVAAIQHHLSGIELLNESNYMKWKSQIDIVLGHLEYDVALLELKPDEPDDTSSESVKEKFQKWIKANRMCILIIQSSISETIRACIPETGSAKEMMDMIRVRFVGLAKPLVGAMIAELRKMKYYGQGSVREYLHKMVNLVHKLKELKMELPDEFLVHMAINSLPKAYESLKVNFNSTDERWSVNELIARCVEEEARLVQGRVLVAHSTNLKATKREMKKSAKKKSHLGPSINDNPKCFFCKMDGHMKKDCIEFKKLQQHKGVP